ncbi:MAG TPA: FAD binding domain-containing protein [Actinomycetota bacterium]|nr:FAD binding domain-containing protein [Actinomycetota bacterium]
MDVLQPTSWGEALAAKGEYPEAVPLAGGTDLLVELNFDRRRPETIIDLTRVVELSEWSRVDGDLRLGAGVNYTRVIAELASELPGLAIASRTVGSPQIRNRGTIGGNLGTSSPAGDALPPLLASGARIELAATGGTRVVPVDEFCTSPKNNVLAPDELIAAIHVPAASGPQQFSKIGTRNAMVIAVASFALSLDPSARSVGTGIGSAGPVPLRATGAERFLEGVLDEEGLWASRGPLSETSVKRFGHLASGAARPIDDVRGSAAYRRHALAVMAERTLTWAWGEYRGVS